jgi:hypothetical protein
MERAPGPDAADGQPEADADVLDGPRFHWSDVADITVNSDGVLNAARQNGQGATLTDFPSGQLLERIGADYAPIPGAGSAS